MVIRSGQVWVKILSVFAQFSLRKNDMGVALGYYISVRIVRVQQVYFSSQNHISRYCTPVGAYRSCLFSNTRTTPVSENAKLLSQSSDLFSLLIYWL